MTEIAHGTVAAKQTNILDKIKKYDHIMNECWNDLYNDDDPDNTSNEIIEIIKKSAVLHYNRMLTACKNQQHIINKNIEAKERRIYFDINKIDLLPFDMVLLIRSFLLPETRLSGIEQNHLNMEIHLHLLSVKTLRKLMNYIFKGFRYIKENVKYCKSYKPTDGCKIHTFMMIAMYPTVKNMSLTKRNLVDRIMRAYHTFRDITPPIRYLKPALRIFALQIFHIMLYLQSIYVKNQKIIQDKKIKR